MGFIIFILKIVYRKVKVFLWFNNMGALGGNFDRYY